MQVSFFDPALVSDEDEEGAAGETGTADTPDTGDEDEAAAHTLLSLSGSKTGVCMCARACVWCAVLTPWSGQIPSVVGGCQC